jgi:hypothetical protein
MFARSATHGTDSIHVVDITWRSHREYEEEDRGSKDIRDIRVHLAVMHAGQEPRGSGEMMSSRHIQHESINQVYRA